MEGCACAEPPGMAPTVATSADAAMTVMRLFRPLSTRGRSPLHVVRLPGELTGSGTTGPTSSPRRLFGNSLRLDDDSPQMGLVPRLFVVARAATIWDSARHPHEPRTGSWVRASEASP